ncbi:hypothetical protein TRVA0_057S00474 [Trichomonascus vanleenenianus]|uniref:sorting nexin 1 n=1 Tax=Trichomonascus vanleenenianus TaxID=2268995 RepID=UPI003ECB2C4F
MDDLHASPWDDQVSLSNNSSSSLVNEPTHEENKTEDPAHEPPATPPPNAVTSPRRKTRRRGKVAPVQLEQADDNPLGPLDAPSETISAQETPEPPKSPEPPTVDQLNLDDPSKALGTPQREPAAGPGSDVHETPASSAPEGPKKPKDKFEISVGDPIKVGDITSAHTVYTVTTNTSAPSFTKPENSVTRRYRDFRWLFHALEANNPGVIVPPPPEKQAVGRFNEDFVESRRAALENMLNKIAQHHSLQSDPDFRLFLESESFSNDVKNRVVTPEELEQTKSGFMSTLGGAFSFSGKYIETNEWFIDKKQYVDQLESQLKSLAKALDLVVTQRKELGEATSEFAAVLENLAGVEVSKQLTNLLSDFSHAQYRIHDVYSRQCMQDVLSLATTLDEYIRLISSIRSVFARRQKAFMTTQTAEQELNKRRQHLDKLNRQGKTLQDKIAQLQQEVEDQEKKVLDCRVVFEDMSKTIMSEFQRFEHEKIHDFRNSVELFLETAVEAQKEAIEIWETFYQRSGFAAAA